jgi:hypothetical protein
MATGADLKEEAKQFIRYEKDKARKIAIVAFPRPGPPPLACVCCSARSFTGPISMMM